MLAVCLSVSLCRQYRSIATHSDISRQLQAAPCDRGLIVSTIGRYTWPVILVAVAQGYAQNMIGVSHRVLLGLWLMFKMTGSWMLWSHVTDNTQLSTNSVVHQSFSNTWRSMAAVLLSLSLYLSIIKVNKKAVLPQGNRAMPQVFFSVEVRQQHSLQVLD